MLTRTVAGRVYDYSHSVGRNAQSGLGFYYPIDAALGDGDTVYILNRGGENISNVPWNRTSTGTRISVLTIGDAHGDEELVADVGRYGDGEGQFIWPTGIAVDSKGSLFITDERLHRVSVFNKDVAFVTSWGARGDAPGLLNGPAGVAVDGDDNLLIVDSLGHRVQRFSAEGHHLGSWGEYGRGDGQLDSPWGVAVDREGNVYVADHKNHRVQKFTPDGRYAATFGSPGSGKGELTRPTGVAVDPEGDVYVCDWANSRVQAFAPDGQFITSFIGDAQQPSLWSQMSIDANADVMKARRRVYTTEPEWRLAMPTGVVFDDRRWRLLIMDTQRSRLQIYNKVRDYLAPQFNL